MQKLVFFVPLKILKVKRRSTIETRDGQSFPFSAEFHFPFSIFRGNCAERKIGGKLAEWNGKWYGKSVWFRFIRSLIGPPNFVIGGESTIRDFHLNLPFKTPKTPTVGAEEYQAWF